MRHQTLRLARSKEKLMRRWLLVPLAFVFLATTAGAVDVAPAVTALSGGCVKLKLCDAEADPGVCKNAAGTANIVANIAGRFAMTAYITSSDATTTSDCNLYTSDNGYQATNRTPITSSTTSTNMSIADSRWSVSATGTFADVWAECPTITGGGDTITMNLYVCPLAR
jgi:hypothetical protein